MAAKLKKSENPMAHARMQETMQALFLEPEKYILPELGMVLYIAPNQKVKDGMKRKFGYKPSDLACLGFASFYTCVGMGDCAIACYAWALEWCYDDNVEPLYLHNTAVALICARKGKQAVLDLLDRSYPKSVKVVRLAPDGETLFNMVFATALVEFASQRPDTLFYGYTKSFGMLTNLVQKTPIWPSNLVYNLSVGYNVPKLDKVSTGFWHSTLQERHIDYLISKGFKRCYAVFDASEFSGLPWNNEEWQATEKAPINGGDGSDFRILFHSNNYLRHLKAISEEIETETGIKTC